MQSEKQINTPQQMSLCESNTLDKRRRHLVMGLGAILGTASLSDILFDSALPTAEAYTPRLTNNTGAGKVLEKEQMIALKAICQTVIPKTETLGAGDVDVHGFIDNQLYHCYPESTQSEIKQLVSQINSQTPHGFAKLQPEQQQIFLTKLDVSTGNDERHHKSFKLLKGLIVFGYYTSEEGASVELKYERFPGPFQGSVPYESIGRAYGNYAYY